MQTAARFSITARSSLLDRLLRVGGRVVSLTFPGPLNQNASIVNIDHNISILDIRRERLPLGQFISFPLAMQLDPIPTHTHDLNAVVIKGIRRRLIRGFDVNA